MSGCLDDWEIPGVSALWSNASLRLQTGQILVIVSLTMAELRKSIHKRLLLETTVAVLKLSVKSFSHLILSIQ